jgi:hypothetical protein
MHPIDCVKRQYRHIECEGFFTLLHSSGLQAQPQVSQMHTGFLLSPLNREVKGYELQDDGL